MKRIYKGMLAGPEAIQSNFNELVSNNQTISSSVLSLTDTKTAQINLNNGITATLFKFGKMVTISFSGNQTSNRQNGIIDCSGTIPTGCRPHGAITAHSVINVGSTVVNDKSLTFIFYPDGKIQSFGTSIDSAPLTVNFSATWVVKD